MYLNYLLRLKSLTIHTSLEQYSLLIFIFLSQIELILTAGNQTSDILTGFTKFQTYIYYAQSLYEIGEYKKALHIYKNALMFKKSLLKGKGSPKATETPKDVMSDTGRYYTDNNLLCKYVTSLVVKLS